MADSNEEVQEAGSESSEKPNFEADYKRVAEYGRSVIDCVRERTENPRFRVKQYSNPLLNKGGFSQEWVVALSKTGEGVTKEDITAAKKAGLSIALEAAVQILVARPRSEQVSEDADSLKRLGQVINRGHGITIMEASSDPNMVLEVSRKALEKLSSVKDLQDSATWTNEKVFKWTNNVFENSSKKINNITTAVENVHR